MKKMSAVLTALTAMCSICMPLPAFAEEEIPAAVQTQDDAAETPAVQTAPIFSLQDAKDEDGVVTTDDGQKWYKVKEFEVGRDYLIAVRKPDGTQGLLTVTDGEEGGFVWKHFSSPDKKTSAPYMGLSCGSYTLVRSGDQLSTDESLFPRGAKLWIHDGSLLVCAVNGEGAFLRYDENAEQPLGFTNNPREASEVQIYSNGATLAHCITAQPHAESYVLENSGYAAPAFTVETSDIMVDEIHWYTDGEEQPGGDKHFTAETLTGLPAGVHRVSCLVEGHDENGIHYREMSAPASFVIAKGVIPDSVMMFSDIHEQFSRVGDAIEQVMAQKNGYIPSLVIFNGDLDSARQPDFDTTYSKNYQQMLAVLGGLDTLYVQGNHDDAAAVAKMTAEAGLGAAADLPANGGVIFRSGSEAVMTNGTNSQKANKIVVYGMNFDAAVKQTEEGTAYSYEAALADMEQFLQETAEHYNGELVLITAHSGLHVLGKQPESLDPGRQPVAEWAGDALYNIDQSYEMAELINRYAENYHMDIMYLFGHDHSRAETEMLLKDGDTLCSTLRFADKSTDTQTLHFTYANSGYLSEKRGSSDGNFSLITRENGSYAYELIRARDGRVQRTELAPKYQPDYASPERFAEMAKIDYEKKNGIAVYPETVIQDGIVTVTLKDADGILLDTYTLDVKTGIGTNAQGGEVDLPQTGVTSGRTAAAAGAAAAMAAAGFWLMHRASRRRNDAE